MIALNHIKRSIEIMRISFTCFYKPSISHIYLRKTTSPVKHALIYARVNQFLKGNNLCAALWE